MKPDRKPASLIVCLLVLSLVIAQASDRRTTLSRVRSVSLPASAVLDEHAQPLIASSGKVGFVASVTGGSLITFSLTSGKVLSTIAIGQAIGPISLVETAGRRLVAVPAANDPKGGSPATVTIIDATSAKHPELKALLMLPRDALITAATTALLTRDARFCLIASSFDVPTLYSFNVETGELVSHLALIGRPSEMAAYEGGDRRLIAIASAASNNLAVIKVDDAGGLSSSANFSPSIARLGEGNNPAFSPDGRTLYIAGETGDRLFALDAASGIILDSISISSPARISVSTNLDGVELVAATRIGQPGGDKRGGVTIVTNLNGRLAAKTEFTPPEGIEFSRANNVAFTTDAATAFVGSTSGILFAFNTENGELESYHQAGSELRRVALSEKAHSIAAVRSASTGDEVTIINFDVVGADGTDPTAPAIELLSPAVVDQGRSKNLKVVVAGKNFTDGDSLVVNGVEMGADLVRGGRALETILPKALFGEVTSINVQVKGASGTLSLPTELRVVRPDSPKLDSISPAVVDGPSTPFNLRVVGKNFRASSAIVVGGRSLNTRLVSANVLEAVVPADIAGTVRPDGVKVQITDLAVPDLTSGNQGALRILGPRVTSLRTDVGKVVAGSNSFGLTVFGENFREGAQVELRINDEVFTALDVRRRSSKVLNLSVPKHVIQNSGDLEVIVRNPEGSPSQARLLSVNAPEITGFGAGRVYAGSSDIKIEVLGKNFRRNARVYVGNARVDKQQVRFRSSSHLTIALNGDLNRLLEKADTLRFQIVNPNEEDGVPSADKALSIVGPQITDARIESVEGDASQVEIVISGANFRRGGTVEFFKLGMESAPVIQSRPVILSSDRIAVKVSAQKLERIGNFKMRVVNPGTIPVVSSFFQPRQAEVATRDHD